MAVAKKLYTNREWFDFAEHVKERDGYKCLRCGRSGTGVILQVHHTVYKRFLAPWEHPLSDCVTLCKNCHAKEHGIVEPDSGWTLISIEDLNDLSGVCERKGCGHEIRYEHVTYHPSWGYKTVGSTCIQHLTRVDQYVSNEVVKVLKKISNFVAESQLFRGTTKKGHAYQFTKFAHNEIRIYGGPGNYAFQLLYKVKGEKWYKFGDVFRKPNKSLEQVKEIAFIRLRLEITTDVDEKEIWQEVYNNADG